MSSIVDQIIKYKQLLENMQLENTFGENPKEAYSDQDVASFLNSIKPNLGNELINYIDSLSDRNEPALAPLSDKANELMDTDYIVNGFLQDELGSMPKGWGITQVHSVNGIRKWYGYNRQNAMVHEATVEEIANRPRVTNHMSHEIKRTDLKDGSDIDLDVDIEFESVMVTRGAKDTRIEPGYGPEWEHTVTDIKLDLPTLYKDSPQAIEDIGGPLKDEEKTHIMQWFDLNKEEADQLANETYSEDGDDEDSRADFEYDKIKDRKLGF